MEYKLTTSRGKPTASNVCLLPQGSVELYEMDTEDRLAVVTACQQRMDPNRHTVLNAAGRVCLCQADQSALGQAIPPELAFNFGQFTATLDANPDDAPWWDQPVNAGDVVLCRVGRDKITGDLMAVRVRRTISESAEVSGQLLSCWGRQRLGVIGVV